MIQIHPLATNRVATTKDNGDGTITISVTDKIPVRVFGDRVLIRPDATLDQYKETNIVIPEVLLEKPLTGVVIATGKKVEEVQVGDKIHFGKFAGHEIELEIDGQKECLILCKEDDILLAING